MKNLASDELVREKVDVQESLRQRIPEEFPALPSEEYTVKAMPAVIGRFDMTATYVCALFLLTNGVIGASGGPVSLLYLLLGAIVFFLPCVLATAQLGVMFPHEGSVYNWTYKALGEFWSFFIGLCYWLTGVLAMVTGADALVTAIQGQNNAWLIEPWQQGLAILIVVSIGGVIGMQRFRTTQNVVNGIFCLTLVSVFLVGIAAVVWLASGHASATNFSDSAGWSVNPGNFALFGIITLNFIGASGPLNMAGEIKGRGEASGRKIITRHLLWGSLIVFACYFVITISVLLVRGQSMLNDAVLPFAAFTAVDMALGKVARDIAVICFLGYGVVSTIFYSYTSARVLMVAGIDQRIPVWFGKLNKNRVPANAILFQMLFAGGFVAIIFMLVPYISRIGGNAATALVDIYTVNSAAITLVWTIPTMFFFINIVFLYRRNPLWFRQHRLFPMPVLWISSAVGFAACLITIGGVLYYSWIPQLIGNGTWWYVVGGLTAACLIVAALGSMFASSEAGWESMR